MTNWPLVVYFSVLSAKHFTNPDSVTVRGDVQGVVEMGAVFEVGLFRLAEVRT